MRTAFGTEYRDLRRLAAELEKDAPVPYLVDRAEGVRARTRAYLKQGLVTKPYALSMLLMARAFLSIARERTNRNRAAA